MNEIMAALDEWFAAEFAVRQRGPHGTLLPNNHDSLQREADRRREAVAVMLCRGPGR